MLDVIYTYWLKVWGPEENWTEEQIAIAVDITNNM